MREPNRLVVAFGSIVGCAASASELGLEAFSREPLPIVQEFSDLQYDPSQQGLTGIAIRIGPAECGYQASVRFGDGPDKVAPAVQAHGVEMEPGRGPVAMDGLGVDLYADLRFEITSDSEHASSFYGLIWKDHLEGVFRFRSGRSQQVDLPLLIKQPPGSLRGLRGVAVSASHQDSGDDLPPPGFEASVKASLQKAGIPILPYDGESPGHPVLVVIVADQEDRVDLELRQDVWLDRDQRVKVSAVTWWYGWAISAEDRAMARVPALITDRFINDYLEANRSVSAEGAR